MQRYKILHRTYYNFSRTVQLEPHFLRLRPREGHELWIESSKLIITPAAYLHWYRDVEDNSVAIATFDTPTNQLKIESELIIQQFNQTPLDFIVADYALDYPFVYNSEDSEVLSPYMNFSVKKGKGSLMDWIADIWSPHERIQTYTLLQRLTRYIYENLSYQSREEPGVQSVDKTLSSGAGSCRDFSYLFMMAVRYLGMASRFVSGYLNTQFIPDDFGATHAWAEVYLPGVGWKGFDPTIGDLAGKDHIAVSVARLPESVPPVAGSFIGPSDSSLNVGVWVTEC